MILSFYKIEILCDLCDTLSVKPKDVNKKTGLSRSFLYACSGFTFCSSTLHPCLYLS
jgi:hypothetical protein